MVNGWVILIALLLLVSVWYINQRKDPHHSQKGGESFQKTIQLGSPILLIIGIAAFISFIVLAVERR
jgi:hypothetical protein